MLTAVEVLVVAIIKYLILDSAGISDVTVSFGLMAFLADNVQSGSIVLSSSYSSLLRLIESYVKDDRLTQCLLKMKSMTIEDMFVLNEVLRTLYNLDSNTTLNGLAGPIRVTQKSFLGIIIRSYLARWESLSFEEACLLVERVNTFVSCGASGCKETTSPTAVPCKGIGSDVAIKALENGDISVTEDAIHSYFDCNEVNPLGASSTSKLRFLASELNAFGKVSSQPQQQTMKVSSSVGRHQMAMLGLATMWSSSLPVGNVHLALSAVEEAMKTAHQRGDHASVARALLLMYHVVHSSHRSSCSAGGGGDVSSSAHDILVRCIARCIQLKLNNLVCEALALLAQLRSGEGLRWAALTSEEAGGLSTGAVLWSSSDNWSLLLVSLLGVPSFIARQLSSPRDQDASTGGGSNKKPAGAVLTAQQRKELSADSPAALTPNFIILGLTAGAVSHSIWMRLGMLQGAELSCRQVARQMVLSLTLSRPECAKLCARWIKAKVDLVNLRKRCAQEPSSTGSLYFSASATNNTNQCPYSGIVRWISKIQALLNSSKYYSISNPHWYKTLMLNCLLYARIHQCMHHRQWDKALRLSYQLMDTSAQGYDMADTADLTVGQSSVNESWLEAKLLLAKIVSQCSGYTVGQELLVDLVNISGSCGFAAVQLDASLVRYALMYQCDARMRSVAVGQLQALFAQALMQNFTSLTVILSKQLLY